MKSAAQKLLVMLRAERHARAAPTRRRPIAAPVRAGRRLDAADGCAMAEQPTGLRRLVRDREHGLPRRAVTTSSPTGSSRAASSADDQRPPGRHRRLARASATVPALRRLPAAGRAAPRRATRPRRSSRSSWTSPGSRRRDDEDDDVDMIPLIDISLVLLIFFMMTATVAGSWRRIDDADMTTRHRARARTPTIDLDRHRPARRTASVVYSHRAGRPARPTRTTEPRHRSSRCSQRLDARLSRRSGRRRCGSPATRSCRSERSQRADRPSSRSGERTGRRSPTIKAEVNERSP